MGPRPLTEDEREGSTVSQTTSITAERIRGARRMGIRHRAEENFCREFKRQILWCSIAAQK
jgi:hypothetical protein